MTKLIGARLSIDGLIQLEGERVYCRRCGARLSGLKVTPGHPRFHPTLDSGVTRARSPRRGALVGLGKIAVGFEEAADGRLVVDLDPRRAGEGPTVPALLRDGEVVRTWAPGSFLLLHAGAGGRCRRTQVFAIGVFLIRAIAAVEAGERVTI